MLGVDLNDEVGLLTGGAEGGLKGRVERFGTLTLLPRLVRLPR
jgi:hypothetical protein